MTTLWADLETFSTRDIMNGPHQYAEDCEVLLFGYAIDDGPPRFGTSRPARECRSNWPVYWPLHK